VRCCVWKREEQSRSNEQTSALPNVDYEVEPDDAKADYRRRQADCQNVPNLVAGNAPSRRRSALNDWCILRHAPSLSRGTHTTFFRSLGSENAQSPAVSSFHLGEKFTGTPIEPGRTEAAGVQRVTLHCSYA
jgi:hypothetical protein